MNKEKRFKLLCLLLEYLNNETYINFNDIYDEKLCVSDLIENLMQDYMR